MSNGKLLTILIAAGFGGLLCGWLATPPSPPTRNSRQFAEQKNKRLPPSAIEAPTAKKKVKDLQAITPRSAEKTAKAKSRPAEGDPSVRKQIAIFPEDPVLGPADAKVTIIEFTDFQCGYCSRGAKTLKQVKQVYGDRVRIVFKHHPLKFHKDAPLAHQASAEAAAQGRFWEYHDLLFADSRKLKRPDLEAHAQRLGLDMQRFRKALDDGVHLPYIKRTSAQSKALGATGTPAFFINGIYLRGAKPFTAFKEIIDRELGG